LQVQFKGGKLKYKRKRREERRAYMMTMS